MESLTKFHALLKELFQFDSSDLDFGIYRILNYKGKKLRILFKTDSPILLKKHSKSTKAVSRKT